MLKRLAIFFFFDKDGIADDYVDYFLNQLRPFLQELCIVVNGKLDTKSHNKLSKIADKILYKENEGLDAYAYKYAIEYYGYKKLASFDEVLCTNFTFFGPFWPMNTMFEKMENIKCDWWSLYKCSMKKPYVEWEHLPSFFIVYKKSLLNTSDFKEYWDTLPKINTYNDSVMFHEQRQTPYFDKRGFKNATYFDFSSYNKQDNDYWPLSKADSLIQKEGFLFLKRRNLYIENGNMNFQLVSRIINYIKAHSEYPLYLIYQNIIRTQDINSLYTKKKYLKWKIKSLISFKYKKREKYKEKINNIITPQKMYNLYFKPNKEFGGYMELDLTNKVKKSHQLHNNAIALNSGRNGLKYIIRALNITELYVPYYTCPSVWRTIEEENCKPIFYDINEKFMPIINFPKESFILYTNYFGVCSKNVNKLYNKYPFLIVDNTQAFYYPNKGCASFYSPRKFFDVSDGGYVYCKKQLSEIFETDLSSSRYIAHLKRLETGSNSGYYNFKENEKILDNVSIKNMSYLTKYLLEHTDYKQIRQIRQRNFKYLHKHLQKYNKLSLSISDEDIAYKYPFLFNSDNLRQVCIDNNIYITKCWDMEEYQLPENSYAKELQNHLFPIPLDQRYSLEDMKYLVSFIIDFINREK